MVREHPIVAKLLWLRSRLNLTTKKHILLKILQEFMGLMLKLSKDGKKRSISMHKGIWTNGRKK
jgi:hypothetical protein